MSPSRIMRQSIIALTSCAMLAACGQAPTTQPVATAPLISLPDVARPDSTVYEVIQPESELRILVMRGGPLGRFGHNHVVGGGVVTGKVALADNLADSRFLLTVDLAGLEVDRPQWRREAGEKFASVPSDEDIAGTRDNMLGEKVLDVVRYPHVRIESVGILGDLPEFSVLARITLKDTTRSLPVPVNLKHEANRIVATGTFTLTQSEFGIEPFSILLGAISVQDDLQINYRIVAKPSE